MLYLVHSYTINNHKNIDKKIGKNLYVCLSIQKIKFQPIISKQN